METSFKHLISVICIQNTTPVTNFVCDLCYNQVQVLVPLAAAQTCSATYTTRGKPPRLLPWFFPEGAWSWLVFRKTKTNVRDSAFGMCSRLCGNGRAEVGAGPCSSSYIFLGL